MLLRLLRGEEEMALADMFSMDCRGTMVDWTSQDMSEVKGYRVLESDRKATEDNRRQRC
jgi:hypothetical protein